MAEQQQQQDEKERARAERSNFAVTVRAAANLPETVWRDERIAAVREMVAPTATLPQLANFLSVAQRYDLDPLLGEIWLGEIDGKLAILTGRASYVKAAQKDPGYLGFDSGVVREKDEFSLIHEGDKVAVIHKITAFDRGKILGAYCVAYHKERRPVVITRMLADYSHLSGKKNWQRNTEDMIETRAIVAALRRQYVLAGLYTEADGGEELRGDAERAGDATRAKMADLRSRMGITPGAGAEGEQIEEAVWEDVTGQQQAPAQTTAPVAEAEDVEGEQADLGPLGEEPPDRR